MDVEYINKCKANELEQKPKEKCIEFSTNFNPVFVYIICDKKPLRPEDVNAQCLST